MRRPSQEYSSSPGSLKNLFFPPEKKNTTYSARAKECPFASGDSGAKGAWTADASMLAYARHGAKHMPAVVNEAHSSIGLVSYAHDSLGRYCFVRQLKGL